MKTCTKCKEEKAATEFHKKVEGLCSVCKACVAIQKWAYHAANQTAILAKKATYRATNKEKLKAKAVANKEKTKARQRAYYITHREEMLARRASYFKAHPETVLASQKIYRTANKEKIKARRQANRERARAREIERLYGKSIEWYNTQLDMQGHVCAICRGVVEDKSGKGRTLNVDHCHDTGKVRELLCSNCNSAMGYFKDSPQVLLSAVDYLIKHQRASVHVERRVYFRA